MITGPLKPPEPGLASRLAFTWWLCQRAYCDLSLRIGQRPQFSGGAASDCGGLAACLETREVGTIPPSERAAQPLARADRCIMNDIDESFVVRCPLRVSRKVP